MIRRLALVIFLAGAIVVTARFLMTPKAKAQSSDRRTPILVELFTSEGCSSCPPADALLAKFDRSQPVAGAELIVLSEHVDYWNYIGWTDPYSLHSSSERQELYAQRFGSSSVYTPEMVVDGNTAFVGSDEPSANRAFAQALKAMKIAVRLSAISLEGAKDLKAHLETNALPASFGRDEGDVYLAITLSHAETDVPSGENSGRRLTHAGVVRELVKVGALRSGQGFAKDVQMKLPVETDPRNLRLVAFVQEPGAGKVIGATMQPVAK